MACNVAWGGHPLLYNCRRSDGAQSSWHIALFSSPGRKFALSFSPAMVVGALLTVVLFRAGLISVIPGMWLLLFGTGIVTGGAFSVKIVPLMRLGFMVPGTGVLFAPARW